MSRSFLRAVLAWALLAPFLVLSLLSPSVMPHRTADGAVSMVLCSVDGPVSVALDPVTGAPLPTEQSSERCAWAMSAELAVLQPEITAKAAPVAERRAQTPPASLTLARATATGLPPATGPPSA